ncbi:hypothetical protein ACGF8B_12495 [Streptomyces sp. NPDC047917]|uniref:hypothetical protein n=1 Tax=Streptomyces sp. NPDC047917 TaxID=3365491 RepID=UPI00371F27A0
MISFAEHGRDPGVHAAPDSFAMDREDKVHLAFGHGVHLLHRRPLTGPAAKIALPALLARFPELSLAAGGQNPRLRCRFAGLSFPPPHADCRDHEN